MTRAGLIALAVFIIATGLLFSLSPRTQQRLSAAVLQAISPVFSTGSSVKTRVVAYTTGVKSLAEFNFTFDLCIRHEQLFAVGELVRRAQEVQFVLDHFGKPPVRAGKIEPWAADLKSLAALPNVSCKISGLATEADWKNWRREDLKPYFGAALENFGFDRVLFGGDWPVCTLATDYEQWLETAGHFVASASAAQQTKIFQTNAERIYRV